MTRFAPRSTRTPERRNAGTGVSEKFKIPPRLVVYPLAEPLSFTRHLYSRHHRWQPALETATYVRSSDTPFSNQKCRFGLYCSKEMRALVVGIHSHIEILWRACIPAYPYLPEGVLDIVESQRRKQRKQK